MRSNSSPSLPNSNSPDIPSSSTTTTSSTSSTSSSNNSGRRRRFFTGSGRIPKASSKISSIDDESNILSPAHFDKYDSNLTRLDLKGRHLRFVPESILSCTNLTSLFLVFNDITELPTDLHTLHLLKILRLFGNQLESIGPSLSHLSQLTLLDCGKNKITSIHEDSLGSLTCLKELNLQLNRLITLPESLSRCTALTNLAVPINRLTALPASMYYLTNLQILDVSHNRLTALPPTIGMLASLTNLNLAGNDLKILPPQLGNCVKLTMVNLQMNLLCELPPELRHLTALKSMKLMKNQVQEFPREVGDLQNLEELLISDNQFINLPRTIGRLKCLTTLKASENAFIYLPPELGDLPSLSELDLAYNQIEALPRELGRLSSLKTAYLGDNSIVKLPKEVAGLSSLTNLNLFFNKLADVPPQLGEVVTLQTLNLARNRLVQLPDSLSGLTRLDTLHLTHNILTELPECLLRLPLLLHLHIASNHITKIPASLGNLTQLRILHLSYNPIEKAYEELHVLGALEQLTELFIGGLGLEQVPPSVFTLTRLNLLSLSCNRLTSPLATDFTSLKALQVLHLSGNHLTSLDPLPLCALQNLKELNLCHNKLVNVCEEICQLGLLQDLDFSANLLERLPPRMAVSMPALTQLKVAYNALQDLPPFSPDHPVWISRHGNPLEEYGKRAKRERGLMKKASRSAQVEEPTTISRRLETRALKLASKRPRPLAAPGQSVRPLNIGWAEMTGRRPDQQDTIAVIREFRGDPHSCYFGVFDGHGGQTASAYTASYLHVILEENLSKIPIIPDALHATFKMMHEEIELKKYDDGCAALVVYLTRDRIWLANAGDSRAIMCRKGRAVQISRDHKSDSVDEKKRIQALHGYITENARVNGVLALSRALGDIEQQPHVTWRPDVLEMDASDAIEYVILACDGLWDVMSNDEVVEQVKASGSPHEAAIRLRDLAYQLGSTDNISVVVVSFL